MSRKVQNHSLHTPLQRFLSFFILFFFLFNITFHLPLSFFRGAFADDQKYYDLVAILVSDTIYDDIENKVKRYGKDIQGVLPNTRALIVPTPDDVSSFEVASLLEGLYHEGHKKLDEDVEYDSRLVGTVLVGDIPLPIVHREDAFSRSILPYVDFEDKLYTYSHSDEKYILSDLNVDGISAEIWHGVIAPNPDLKHQIGEDDEGADRSQGDIYDAKIDGLEQYFDKNHDFYAGQGLFDTSKGVVSGNLSDTLAPGYEPHIFYYNQQVEQSAINTEKYRGYNVWMQNREDINYSRFSSKLATRIEQMVHGAQNEEIAKLLREVAPSLAGDYEDPEIPELPPESEGVTPDVENSYSDVQSMKTILGSLRKYIEIFNGPTIASFRKGGLDAGRYGSDEDNISVDTIPALVTLMDEAAVSIIRSANNDVEKYLDNKIKTEWSGTTPVPLTYKIIRSGYTGSDNRTDEQNQDTQTGSTDGTDKRGPLVSSCNTEVYTHFSYGRKGIDITTNEECSIYRGSIWNFREDGRDGYNFAGKTVEANRGRDVILVEDDIDFCGEELGASETGITAGITGYWGGNTPINLYGATPASGEFTLGEHDINTAIVPLYDIVGSKKVSGDEIDPGAYHAYGIGGSPTVMDPATSAGNPNRSSTCEHADYILTYGGKYEGGEHDPILGDDLENGGSCEELLDKEITDVTLREEFSCDTKHEVYRGDWGQPLPLPGSCYLFNPGECHRVVCKGAGGVYYDSGAEAGEPGYCDELENGFGEVEGRCGVHDERSSDVCLDDTNGGNITTHIFEWTFLGEDRAREYKSPTSEELADQIISKFAPDLPIDAERYVEFKGRGDVLNRRIFYPNFFRAVDPDNGATDYSNVHAPMSAYILQMEEHINGVISVLNPPAELKLFQALGGFIEGAPALPASEMIPPLEPYESFGEIKNIDFYNTLWSAIMWYQLGTTSNKYRFIFENYLNDPFDDYLVDTYELRKAPAGRILPENKKLYEIVYLNTPGDEQNMFVKMSPEDILPNPYEQELLNIQNLKSNLLSLSISSGQDIDSSSDSCTPPGGVAIWDYVAAIECGLRPTSPANISGTQITQPYIAPEVSGEETIVFDSTLLTFTDDVLEIETTPTAVSSEGGINLFLYDENKQKYSDLTTPVNNHNLVSQKMLLGISNYIEGAYEDLNYPITLNITNGVGFNFNKTYSASDLSFFTPVTSLSQSAIYKLNITDSNGNTGEQLLHVVAGKLDSVEIQLDANIIESNGTQLQNHILLHDKFDNLITGEMYNIEVSLDGRSTQFVNSTEPDLIRIQTFNGSQSFILKSTDKTGTTDIAVKVFDRQNNLLTQGETSIDVVDTLDIGESRSIGVQQLSDIYVGAQQYDIEVEILDQNGSIYSQYDGFASVDINQLYGDVKGYTIQPDLLTGITPDETYQNLSLTDQSRIQFIDGRAKLSLITASSAGTDIPISFISPSLARPDNLYIDILPNESMQVDLTLSQQYLPSSMDGLSNPKFPAIIPIQNFSVARVELKDSYGNLAVDDNITQLSLEIPEQYSRVIRVEQATKKVSNGVADFKIYSSNASGRAYFKVKAQGSSFSNGVEITGQSPFEKILLDDIDGMRDGEAEEAILSSLGKLFFNESGPDHYISLFQGKQDLLDSEDFDELSNALQDEIESLWDSTNTYTIDSLDYAIGKIDTFYLWKHDTIDYLSREPATRRYNGLYSVLLGAPYGNYNTPDYLAGDLLFDDANRSLVVTSILNDPYEKNDVFQLSTKGGFESISKTSNLFQDIEFAPFINKNGKLEISVYNNALHILIGSIVYNISDFEAISCTIENEDIDSCINPEVSSLVMQSSDPEVISYTTERSSVLKSLLGGKILEISEDGIWQNYHKIGLEVASQDDQESLKLNISHKGSIAGQVLLSLKDMDLNISRNKEVFQQKQSLLENTLLLYLDSSRYSQRRVDESDYSVTRVSYNDEFQSTTLLDSFHRESAHGFENSVAEKNVGWESRNKSLLSFSAGKSVGESVQDYMSFSVVNLGDPVVGLRGGALTTLPPESEDVSVIRGFDNSIGEILNNETDLEEYQVFDYNNDTKPDILLIKSTGHLKLLENVGSSQRFRDRGNIAHIVDMGDTKQIFTGDFTGDGYDDIYFINNESHPYLLNNYKTTFHRVSLSEPLELENDTSIMLTRVFDMDDDTISDIVSLDSVGDLNIYYGSGGISTLQQELDERQDPIFTKNNIDGGLGITLDESERSGGGLVYFDGLYQPDPIGTNNDVVKQTTEEILEKFEEVALILAEPGGRTPEGQGLGEDPDLTEAAKRFVDTTVFSEISYDPDNNSADADPLDQIKSSIGDSADPRLGGYEAKANQALADIGEAYGDSLGYSDDIVGQTPTNFIKSQYASFLGLETTKYFTSSASGAISSGSKLQANLQITNTSSDTLTNIVYLESTDNLFIFDKASLTVSRDDVRVQNGFQGFEFLLDGFDLAPGEQLDITYEVQLLPVTFGYLEVGYFEQDTIGDDPYGDIILKSDHTNCSGNFTLYSSLSQRSYRAEVAEPTCDPDKNQIPEFLSNNEIDEYQYDDEGNKIDEPNGVPDYIDDMEQELKETSAKKLLNNSCLASEDGGSAGDAPGNFPTDLSQIVWHGRDVSSWPATAQLDPISVSGEFINLKYDKAGVWPQGYPLGGSDPLVANAWIFYEEGGKWHADTFEWMRPNQGQKFAVAVEGGGHIHSKPKGWTPAFGETYGFMVSGFARIGATPNIQERSNIEFYDCGNGGLLGALHKDSDGDGLPDIDDRSPHYSDENTSIDQFNERVDELSDSLDDLIGGLCRGFGGGGSYVMPLNWAPLAPGGDPTLYGYPIGDGLNIDEGYPLFSSVTGYVGSCGSTTCCYPVVHPVSSLSYVPDSVNCVDSSASGATTSAGGELGVWQAANTYRLFVTPTLTGSAGMAFCFGGPAEKFGQNPGPGFSPIISGGNCIIAAAPLFKESYDVDDIGDPASTGPVLWSGNGGSGGGGSGDFGLINANCSSAGQISDAEPQNYLTSGYLDSYLGLRQSAGSSSTILPPTLQRQTKEILEGSNRGDKQKSLFTPRSLLSAGPTDGTSGVVDMSISVDTSKLGEGSFQDVIKIQNKRVGAFPDYLMDWVTRQIEEIVTKLTDFPTLYIILPSFDHLFQDDWSELGDSLEEAKSGGVNAPSVEDIKTAEGLNDLQILSDTQISGIQEAYRFLANVPYINIEEQVINIDVPWPTQDVDGVKQQWKVAGEQWRDEIEKTREQWGGIDKNNVLADADRLIRSFEKNIERLEEYGQIPERISELLAIKQQWLTQILENIEAVSDLMGGWVYRNGKTFKQWVQTYMLIKALLKSWQLIIDIFNDYDDQCHDCKNERYDLQYFIWKLISIVIPDIPVIIFPKWPDLILDLHNVRVGMTIALPALNFNPRPLVLPRIPTLDLPDDPNVRIEIPNIPLLPKLEIPDLPPIPSIELFDLPDLPKAPKLPKMLASFEGVLKIIKLVVKMMCILKGIPLVPEIHAGDHIAFITERTGYLPIDFIDMRLPQFSFPFVDAIKTTAYVNLEYETDFIIEAAQSIATPMRVFSNDLVNKLRINRIDTTIGVDIPDEIDVGVDSSGDIDISSAADLGIFIVRGIGNLTAYMSEQSTKTIPANDFIGLAYHSLSQLDITDNDSFDQIKADFEDLANYSFSKEDRFITELQKNNTEKFDTLRAIIEYEQVQNKQDAHTIEQEIYATTFRPIKADMPSYNDRFEIHNARFKDAAAGLVTGKNYQSEEFSAQGDKLLARVDSQIGGYKNKIYALEQSGELSEPQNACQEENKSKYSRDYNGVYIVEDDLTYRLFNYMQELKGDENITRLDLDGDDDIDILYLAENHLYVKYNRTSTPLEDYVSDNPLEIKIRNNVYFNGDIFYEVIDHFEEEVVSSNNINISFDVHPNPDIQNYRLELSNNLSSVENQILPESIHLADLQKQNRANAARDGRIIDALAHSDDTTLLESSDPEIGSPYSIRANQAYISYVGEVADVTLTTPSMRDLNDDISEENKRINIAPDTNIYTRNSSVKIGYVDADNQPQTLIIPARSNARFEENIKIHSITGPLYVEGIPEPACSEVEGVEECVEFDDTTMYTGQKILDYIHMPLLPGSSLEFDDTTSRLTEKSRIEIAYYDDAILNLDARYTKSYQLVHVNESGGKYDIRLQQENAYYYGKLYGFNGEDTSTISQRSLIAPQLKADTFPPELDYNGGISIALTQRETLALDEHILEDSDLRDVIDVVIDMDIEIDSDEDGDPSNDVDVNLDNQQDIDDVEIRVGLGKINLAFGPYNEPIEKQIRISIIDAAGNPGYQDIPFRVYAPIPEITGYDETTLSGSLSEPIPDIPVDVYRYRQGGLSRLAIGGPISGSGGIWSSNGPFTGSGLTLTSSGLTLADIDEINGEMDVLDVAITGYRVDTGGIYPKVVLQNNGDDIYYHYPHMGSENTISIVSGFVDIVEDGMYLSFTNKSFYGYYTLPSTAPYNPGVTVIYRASSTAREPLFTLYPDGRVDTLNEFYDLEYTTTDRQLTFSLLDKYFNREVAQILYHLGDGYILDEQSYAR